MNKIIISNKPAHVCGQMAVSYTTAFSFVIVYDNKENEIKEKK